MALHEGVFEEEPEMFFCAGKEDSQKFWETNRTKTRRSERQPAPADRKAAEAIMINMAMHIK